MFKKIAVAFDESPEAQRAFRSALDLAKLAGASVVLVTVVEKLPAYVSYVSAVAPDVPHLLKAERQSFYQDMQSRAKELAERAGVPIDTRLVEGDEVESLVQAVQQLRPDLLVVGLRRDPGGISSLLGGTAHHLALRAECDLLGIR